MTRPERESARSVCGAAWHEDHPLAQGPWRREIAGAPIPHCRRGLDDRTDPGPLGAPATRLRSALRRGQAALRHSSGKGGNLLGKKGLDRWSAIRQLQSKEPTMTSSPICSYPYETYSVRVSTIDQDLSIQTTALKAASCDVVRSGKVSATQPTREGRVGHPATVPSA